MGASDSFITDISFHPNANILLLVTTDYESFTLDLQNFKLDSVASDSEIISGNALVVTTIIYLSSMLVPQGRQTSRWPLGWYRASQTSWTRFQVAVLPVQA